MIGVKNIFPECEADTLLVELILQRGRPGHRYGITKVQSALKADTNQCIIGVIDTDRFKNEERYKYIQEFRETLSDKIAEEGLLFLKKPNTNKHLIRIHPGFEKWIWEVAIRCNLECPFDSIELLKKATKSQKVYENKELKKFINDVVSLNPPPIQTLRTWLMKALE